MLEEAFAREHFRKRSHNELRIKAWPSLRLNCLELCGAEKGLLGQLLPSRQRLALLRAFRQPIGAEEAHVARPHRRGVLVVDGLPALERGPDRVEARVAVAPRLEARVAVAPLPERLHRLRQRTGSAPPFQARNMVDALPWRRVVRRRHRRSALHLDVDRWATVGWRHLNQSGLPGAPGGPRAKAEELIDEEREWVNEDGHITVEQPRESCCKLERERHEGERPLEPARAWGAVGVAEPPSRSRYEDEGEDGPEGDEQGKQDEVDDECDLQSLRRRRPDACGGH